MNASYAKCGVRVEVAVHLRSKDDTSGEGLLKYINVGDKSTMVAQLPQQVFFLLVLVTGTTTIGTMRMYGVELSEKSTRFSSTRTSTTTMPESRDYFSTLREESFVDIPRTRMNKEAKKLLKTINVIKSESLINREEESTPKQSSEELTTYFSTIYDSFDDYSSPSFSSIKNIPVTSIDPIYSSEDAKKNLQKKLPVSKNFDSYILSSKKIKTTLVEPKSRRMKIKKIRSTINGKKIRYLRDASDDNNCEGFEINEEGKQEFHSPNYPENYPPLTNCVLVLEAERGMLLKLDFREVFALESKSKEGDCRFDYLEVRDGQYGFSPRIGTFCDNTFPPEIISQSRFLWLNFHSDDTIEYQGFKAVWSTVPRPVTGTIPAEQEPCIYHQDIPADFELKTDMIAEAKKLATSNRVALDCLWVMEAGPSMRMQLTFDAFKLEKPNDCSANFLDVFDGHTDEPSRVKKFCGSIAEALSTRTGTMYVRLYLEQKAINSSFTALITAVRDKINNQACKDDEYDCDDTTCIASSLKCNQRKNCRFQRDEDETMCGTISETQDRTRIVIIIVIFCLIMFGLCTVFLFNCIRKLRRDHRIIREHIRQSREDRLDEIGRRDRTPCPLSVSRADVREAGSESPPIEEVDSSKELIPAPSFVSRQHQHPPNNYKNKELSLSLKYGNKDINDIHQSNNVSNATQERLQESIDEPDMCDSSCQTRESLFSPSLPDGILQSPEFSTFSKHRLSNGATETRMSHKNSRQQAPSSASSSLSHRQDCHERNMSDTLRGNSQISSGNHEGSAQICPKHNPIPAPPGWSLHDPQFPQITSSSSSVDGSRENSSYRRYQSPKPTETTPNNYHQRYPFPVVTRQNTVGSGERYGSFIYGSERESSNTASVNSAAVSAAAATSAAATTSAPAAATSSATNSPIYRNDSRYRAEAVIEVDQQKRPFSIESTKSAPDVIATH